jgi:hypothetical protein
MVMYSNIYLKAEIKLYLQLLNIKLLKYQTVLIIDSF